VSKYFANSCKKVNSVNQKQIQVQYNIMCASDGVLVQRKKTPNFDPYIS
jgi:hypothetical protein